MKRIYPSIMGVAALTGLASIASSAAACTATGFFRDSINLTAALIDPAGTVSGDVDATGCNIGIYYGPGAHGHIDGASIHGANYFGVANNGGRVDIRESTVYDIGETPLNGDQHGVAIYFAFASAAKGDITDNVVWNYQKGGIVVNGPLAGSTISGNTVIGQGPVDFIAQNGIQAGFGADVDQITGNLVVGNSYTGAGLTASGGIILVGGACYGGAPQTGTSAKDNIAVGNDVGLWFSNLDISCSPVTTPTRDSANDDTVRNNAVNNTTGNGPTQGYQAGIADQGDQDSIIDNNICGIGYTGPSTSAHVLFTIDVTVTNNPIVKDNATCSTATPVTNAEDGMIPDPPGATPHGPLRPSVIQ
jgi:hypothetical protein